MAVGRWSSERAQRWWAEQPWPVGCNFVPSTAGNQLEMWQAESFDPITIGRELGFAADLGLNAVRVYLHDLVWQEDRPGLLARVEAFLGLAAAHGLRTLLVLFDDVWAPDPKPGRQPDPYPGRHNSTWVKSPGVPALLAYEADAGLRARLEAYVTGVVAAFGRDARVLGWDLYNEPGGNTPFGKPVGTLSLPLLRDAFRWARAAEPEQPLTSGLWWNTLAPVEREIHALQLEESDVVSFHHYGSARELETLIDGLWRLTGRPLLCTEYLARPLGSRFETHLPIFDARGVGAFHWGLVAGRSQTLYPWWSWLDETPKPEPTPWFHDVLRPDGTPFDAEEVAFVRCLLEERRGRGTAQR
jgi:hypothetical protein